MNLKRIVKYAGENKLLMLLNVVVLMVLLLPFGRVQQQAGSGEDAPLVWVNGFIYEDFLSILFYSLVILLTASLQVARSSVIRMILATLNLFVCGLSSLFAAGSMILVAPDYKPYFGCVLTLSLAPISFFVLIEEGIRAGQKRREKGLEMVASVPE